MYVNNKRVLDFIVIDMIKLADKEAVTSVYCTLLITEGLVM